MEWIESISKAISYIEMYNAPSDYPNGIHDENYYSEIWVPVKKK